MTRYILTYASALLALLLGVLIIVQEGAAWRIPAERFYPSSKEMRAAESALCLGTDMDGDTQLGSKPGEQLITCSHDRGAETDLYVWGDSHARHLLAGLVAAYPQTNIHIIYYTSCLSESGSGAYVYTYEGRTALAEGCVARNRQARAFFAQAAPSRIILHQYFGYEGQFSPEWYEAAAELVGDLTDKGHRVAFMGGVARPGLALGDCLAVPAVIPSAQVQRRCTGQKELSDMVLRRNAELAQRWEDRFVDTSDFFCPDLSECFVTAGQVLLFRDAHHLTTEGARRMIGHVKPRLSALLDL